MSGPFNQNSLDRCIARSDDVLAHIGDNNLEDTRKALEESYHGCFSSFSGYADELTSEISEVPEH